jgi:hypothetical protein
VGREVSLWWRRRALPDAPRHGFGWGGVWTLEVWARVALALGGQGTVQCRCGVGTGEWGAGERPDGPVIGGRPRASATAPGCGIGP